MKVTINNEVRAANLQSEQSLPFLVRPAQGEADLVAWVNAHAQEIETSLLHYGGILFRDFDVFEQEEFSRFIETIFPEALQYTERSTPRTRLSEKIYTSTEYPASRSIALHNESSYASVWPGKICFYCLNPATHQGETPIADVRKVFKRISPGIREQFKKRGWMLVRNFDQAMGLSWQSAFQTSQRAAVEEYCRNAQIDYEWLGEDSLRVRQVRPAVSRHPKTGEPVWFNHAAFWHVSSLDRETREALLEVYSLEELPYNTYYGDGAPLEDTVVAHIREAYEREKVVFTWQKGDVLLLDNLLTAHGRNPFAGDRKILVAMAEPHSFNECAMQA